jgi:general secretion pathway protein C
MWARWSAWGIWAVVAASAVTWGLRFWVAPRPVPAHAAPVDMQRSAQGDVARLLGAGPVAASAATAAAPPPAPGSDRIKLVGLVAAARDDAPRRHGLALLALDGKPPRTYRVGAAIDDQWVLQSVDQRGVAIGPAGGAAAVVLEMPALPAAAVGTLPAPGAEPAAAPGRPPIVPAVPRIPPPPMAVPLPVPGAVPGAIPGADDDQGAVPPPGPSALGGTLPGAVRLPPDRMLRRGGVPPEPD